MISRVGQEGDDDVSWAMILPMFSDRRWGHRIGESSFVAVCRVRVKMRKRANEGDTDDDALRFSLSMLKSREKRLLTYPQHSAMLNPLMSAVDLPWERKETTRGEGGARREKRNKTQIFIKLIIDSCCAFLLVLFESRVSHRLDDGNHCEERDNSNNRKNQRGTRRFSALPFDV